MVAATESGEWLPKACCSVLNVSWFQPVEVSEGQVTSGRKPWYFPAEKIRMQTEYL